VPEGLVAPRWHRAGPAWADQDRSRLDQVRAEELVPEACGRTGLRLAAASGSRYRPTARAAVVPRLRRLAVCGSPSCTSCSSSTIPSPLCLLPGANQPDSLCLPRAQVVHNDEPGRPGHGPAIEQIGDRYIVIVIAIDEDESKVALRCSALYLGIVSRESPRARVWRPGNFPSMNALAFATNACPPRSNETTVMSGRAPRNT
jgi:hypothetical protein